MVIFLLASVMKLIFVLDLFKRVHIYWVLNSNDKSSSCNNLGPLKKKKERKELKKKNIFPKCDLLNSLKKKKKNQNFSTQKKGFNLNLRTKSKILPLLYGNFSVCLIPLFHSNNCWGAPTDFIQCLSQSFYLS